MKWTIIYYLLGGVQMINKDSGLDRWGVII